MSVRAIEGRGVNRANAECDECGRTEVVTCAYTRGAGGEWHPDEGQIKNKIVKLCPPWAIIKGRFLCPSCNSKRKVVKMEDVKPKAEPPREPTKAEKRQIMQMLDECYDTENERYMSGDTDDTVAEVLGVMPGWVTSLREEFFGPDGGNENIEELAGNLAEFERELKAFGQQAKQFVERTDKKLAEVSRMRVELDRIKKAVGPRNLRKAGVQG